MKMDIVAGSGNDEFYTPRYAIEPLVKYVPKGAIVWCPFDKPESLIAKRFLENGNNVVSSHIDEGKDFFFHQEKCDFIISNPPYSLKNEVFERLFAFARPFAMLVGVVGLFESQKRFAMFKNNTFEIMYLNKRVSYFKSYEDPKPSLNPPFSSVWLTSKVLPKQIMFEEIIK
jgi:hypothetical protein